MTETVSRVIPTIEHSIESTRPEDYRTVTERYYTKYYCLDEDRERRHDILVLNHSNRICLITLAPTHPVIARGLKITKVNFEVSKKTDRKSNKTSGKSKKGGQTLEHTSILAIVETETENFPVKVSFNFLSCHSYFENVSLQAVVPGKLICINQELVSSPQKLQTHTDSEGHIAIILPAKGQYESVKGYLVNSEDFEKLQI